MIENLVKLKDYVPIFELLIKLVILGIIIFAFRKSIYNLVDSVIERIRRGDNLKAGPFEISGKLKELDYVAPEEKSSNDIELGDDGEKREKHRVEIYEKNRGLFLTHIISNQRANHHIVFIYLIRHKSNNFHDIADAEFFFGHMWGNKVIHADIDKQIIGVSTTAYSPFLCTCCIKFDDGESITLDRYIDFEMVKELV